MILIISYPEEDHTQEVTRRLQDMGASVVLMDLADFPARRRLSCEWRVGEPAHYWIETDDGMVDLSQAQACWWRRVSAYRVDEQVNDPTLASFALSETTQAVEGMLDSLNCTWVNSRQHDSMAHHKPWQWTQAQAAGLNVPKTLITTDPAQARAFIEQVGIGRVVVKPFLATFDVWRETRLVTTDDLNKIELIRYAPAIFQEYIDGVDLRITVIGEHIFAAEIDARDTSYPCDMRMVIGEAKVKAVELPDDLSAALLDLQKRLGITYGAIDMRRTSDGQYHFFEVNPAGQWLFVERLTGLPISQTIAEHLFQLSQTSSNMLDTNQTQKVA